MRTSVALVLIAAMLIPPASAHGAPETREIDVRTMADGTASGDYGVYDGALSSGAPDLLVLDMREAFDGEGQPMVVFRIIHQLGDPEAGSLGLDLSFSAGGSDHAYEMETTDGLQYTSSTFARIDGPFDVGDGTPKAVEGWVPLSALGVKTGDDLTDIRITSSLGGTVADRMPGTYDEAGVTVPAVPPEDAIPGVYTVQGPAALLDIALSVNTLEVGEAETANVTISNPLTSMEQFVTISTTAPDGTAATLSSDGLALAPNETRTITLSIDGVGEGEVAIHVASDLGGYQTLVLPLIGAATTGDDSDVLSGDLAKGGSFQHTFTTIGTFEYHCHPHPWMMASITIEQADEGQEPSTHKVKIVETDATDGQSWRFEPADLTIQAGDTVAWVNEGSQIHVIMGGVAGAGHGVAGEGHHGAGEGHHGEDESPGENVIDDKGTPGFQPLLVLAALGVALLARRR